MTSRNVPLFIAFRTLTRAILFAPYIQFFMVEVRSMTDAEYGLLQGIYYLGVVCCEVPSGVLADRIGRKGILVLGAVVSAAGCWIFAASYGFWAFAVGEVCFAVGTAFISGADSAMLYDSLAAAGRPHEYPRAEGAAQASWLMMTAIGLPLADRFLLVDGDPVRVYWVTGGLCLAGAVVGAWLREPPVSHRLTSREITVGALRDVVHVPGIARLILYGVGVFALLRAAIVMFFHPALESMAVPVRFYGTILAGVNLVGAASAWLVGSRLRRTGERVLLVAMPLALLAMFLGLTQLKTPAAAGLFCVQGAALAIYPLLTRSILNRLVPSPQRRATTLSLESLACRLAFCPLAFFAGWAQDARGVDQAMAATALLAAIPLLIVAVQARRRAKTV